MANIKELKAQLAAAQKARTDVKENILKMRKAKKDEALAEVSKIKVKGAKFKEVQSSYIVFSIDGLAKSTVKIDVGHLSLSRLRGEGPQLTEANVGDLLRIIGDSESFANELIRPDNFRSEFNAIDEGVSFDVQVKNTKNSLDALESLVNIIKNDKATRQILVKYIELEAQTWAGDDEIEKQRSGLDSQIKNLKEQIKASLVEDITAAYNKGIKFQPKTLEELYRSFEDTKDVLRVIAPNASYGTIDGFSAEVVGYEGQGRQGAKAFAGIKVFPLLWNRGNDNSISVDSIKFKKINAKSVSVIGTPEYGSKLVNIDNSTNYDAWLYATSYSSSRRGNDYVTNQEKGLKQVKASTTIDRLIAIAVAYDPSLVKDYKELFKQQ